MFLIVNGLLLAAIEPPRASIKPVYPNKSR